MATAIRKAVSAWAQMSLPAAPEDRGERAIAALAHSTRRLAKADIQGPVADRVLELVRSMHTGEELLHLRELLRRADY